MAIKQGTLSSYPLPNPVRATVKNPNGSPHQVMGEDGIPLKVPDFEGTRYALRLLMDAVNRLENPSPSPIASVPSTAFIQIQPSQSGSVFANSGATFEIDFTLPTANPQRPPLQYTFFLDAAFTLKIIGSAGAKISAQGTTSVANGSISSATLHNSVTLTCIAQNRWVATAISGTWTVV